jgi:uncharacterized Zn ribbon protein
VTWHCTRCRREWTTDDGIVFHIHSCVAEFDDRDKLARRRRVPMDREARGAFYHALFEQVGEEQTWRR